MELLNREDAWNRLEGAWGRCAGGDPAVVFVEGAAGCGKTELLLQFTGWAAARGAFVLQAGAVAGDDSPHGVLRRLIHSLSSADPAERLPSWSGGAELPSLQEFTDGLRGLAVRAPVVVCVDDLQDADGPSLSHLLHLCRGLRRTPVLLLLGHRLGSFEPGGPEARTEFLRHEGFTAVRVVRLNAHGSAALVGRHTEGTHDAALAARLHHVTGGNPLLLKALLCEHPEAPRRPDEWPTPAPG
ncbi:ATP-binding protein, partial [Streptomyces sp. T-3]|nr:ATP-binding protein [Streptomyces sp. T-3]